MDRLMALVSKLRKHRNECSKIITQLCQNLFSSSPLDFFDYQSYKYDSKTVILSTQPRYSEYCLQQRLQFSLKDLHQIYHTGHQQFFLSNKMPLPLVLQHDALNNLQQMILSGQQCQIYHRLYFLRKHQNGFTATGFGVTSETAHIFEYYFNNLKKLRCFAQYMQMQLRHIVTQDRATDTPRENKKVNFKATCEAKKVLINLQYGCISLSQRRFACLQYYLASHTAREIANLTKLSRRSVEYHILHVKKQLRMSSRKELWYLLHKNGLLGKHITTNKPWA